MLRLAINGYGRIGRSILRALYERPLRSELVIVAINELADAGTVLHLTRYDSTHGRFPKPLEGDANRLQVDGDTITLLNHSQIDALPWNELGVDMVLECTGAFSDRATAEMHLHQGAGKGDALAFPTRQGQDVAVQIARHIRAVGCVQHGLAPIAAQAAAPEQAKADHLLHPEGKGQFVALGHHRAPRRQCLGGKAREVHPIQQDTAIARAQLAAQGLQTGGFSRPVRSQNGGDLAGLDFQMHLAQGHMGAIANRNLVKFQRHDARPRCRITR